MCSRITKTYNLEENIMIIEKTCVGCGTTFTCMEELAEETLYCSNVCEENHSIFKDDVQPKDLEYLD